MNTLNFYTTAGRQYSQGHYDYFIMLSDDNRRVIEKELYLLHRFKDEDTTIANNAHNFTRKCFSFINLKSAFLALCNTPILTDIPHNPAFKGKVIFPTLAELWENWQVWEVIAFFEYALEMDFNC